jgi:hypothetical protein
MVESEEASPRYRYSIDSAQSGHSLGAVVGCGPSRCDKSLSSSSANYDEDLPAILSSLEVPIPSYEIERLKLLRETRLLDSLPNEEEYGRLANLAARIFNVSRSINGSLLAR